MMTNLFDQFKIPTLLGLNMMLLTMLLPPMLIFTNPSRLITDRTATLMELIIKMTTKHFMTLLNEKGHKWAPMLTALFFVILTQNIIGLLPYTFTPTTQLAMNMALAIPLWLGTVLLGLRTQTAKALAHLLPEGTPAPLIPVLIIIETISLLMRPLALGVRLTANMTAGHLLLQLISSTTLTTIVSSPLLTLPTGTLLIMLMILELAVAIIQAYVFTLLVCLYLQENTYDTPNTPIPHSNTEPMTYS
uniref:ATP synthase subunit a n=1 Tax=Laudakia vulgaris brachydactyla TaxID=3240327 RepID=C0SPE3_9SAUR|nr:adenosine triphosphate subunit 6 [Stellagama stellio brachydactyla]